jgi:serine-type D-Ala-D-Ala carboxypeptidase (penicillin-binding protein 5/6)
MLVQQIIGDLAPPATTAKSWSILDGRTGEVLFGKAEHERREIASMTKIMTGFIVIQIMRKLYVSAEMTKL